MIVVFLEQIKMELLKIYRLEIFLESKISYGTPATPNTQAIPVARKIEIQCYKKFININPLTRDL